MTKPPSGTGPGPEQEPGPDAEPDPEDRAPEQPHVRETRRVVIDPAGPVLVEGPVEVDLGDGRTVTSDRFMVALCACRRSRTYPWCDTSHRRRSRPRGRPQLAPDSEEFSDGRRPEQ